MITCTEVTNGQPGYNLWNQEKQEFNAVTLTAAATHRVGDRLTIEIDDLPTNSGVPIMSLYSFFGSIFLEIPKSMIFILRDSLLWSITFSG